MFSLNLTNFNKEGEIFLKIGLPILGSQLVMYGMTTTDYIMAGYASSSDLAGVGLAAAIFNPAFFLSAGVMFGITPIIAQLYGAKDYALIKVKSRKFLWTALLVGVIFFIFLRSSGFIFDFLESERDMLEISTGYLSAISFGAIPMTIFQALRGYSEGITKTKVVFFLNLFAFLLNIPLNYLFIFYFELGGVGCGVAPVPDAIAPKYTGGRYVGTSSDSTDPGYYWVNTYNLSSRPLYVIPSLTAHEAVPGHHLQGALNNELPKSIPKFRRNLYLSAYGEGWGLYTEYLAEEMGIYTTPYEHFGKLTYEMWRACRLVVDTGIHAFGWTRDEAVNFMAENTALSLHEINTEIDRYISWPGQALAYKIGEMKIRELRQKAEEELGNQFDIREFHEVILEKGTVTLPILSELINNYIKFKNNNS
tara:strand:- start:94 stop:1356 length:1263 start_codon:yes stop_codon:yes gene_type:complete